MDIRCPVCGEPWDHDELHEMGSWVGEDDLTYPEARQRFQVEGCKAFGSSHNEQTIGSTRAHLAGALYDLLGDDIDGAAAMFEDLEYSGFDFD